AERVRADWLVDERHVRLVEREQRLAKRPGERLDLLERQQDPGWVVRIAQEQQPRPRLDGRRHDRVDVHREVVLGPRPPLVDDAAGHAHRSRVLAERRPDHERRVARIDERECQQPDQLRRAVRDDYLLDADALAPRQRLTERGRPIVRVVRPHRRARRRDRRRRWSERVGVDAEVDDLLAPEPERSQLGVADAAVVDGGERLDVRARPDHAAAPARRHTTPASAISPSAAMSPRATMRWAPAMSAAWIARVASPSRYWPGFSSRTPSAPAIALIGQPAFGLSVAPWSRRSASKPEHGAPPPSAAPTRTTPAASRAGTRFNRSSSRAAHLPSSS